MELERYHIVTYQGFIQEIYGKRVCIGKELRKWFTFPEWECADIIARTPRGNSVELIKCGRSQDVEDEG